ncbi:MAG: DUF72 domain-containing protein [Verrucomicrobia bacterium]|nr:MAG: DUF72 domain-containing protein [Verrucomicrobiota bacterium]
MPFNRANMKSVAAALAANGVFIGTSSWKYPGWRSQLYDENRYSWRGAFSQARFNRDCLAEYAEVFKTVCVDAAYYKFPDHRYLEGMMNAVPDDFRFGLKVTDEITIKKFTKLPRFGLRAGKLNENFLNADLFASAFLKPCEPFRKNVGLLIFEFSRFYPSDYQHGRDFVADLDGFLGKLPNGWPYAVEIRNKHFLHSDYFAALKRHGTAHVFNSWAEMPPIHEQLSLEGSRTQPSLCPARFLLKPGRKYEESVKLFEPYDTVKEPYPDARAAGAALIKKGIKAGPGSKTFIFVNNRLEGNALDTIAAMVEESGWQAAG